jgi:multiple sugar transport system ATP-binding protein
MRRPAVSHDCSGIGVATRGVVLAEVRLREVSKIFKGSVVVDRLDLYIADGEFLVLVGPSGCGKSTTLNMVAGLEDPTSGAIFIGGKDVTRLPPKARGVAMVFQNYALYPHLTVAGNLGFGLTIAKVQPAEIKRKVTAIAETLGIVDLLERRPRELSGGQRQRVALGRAIVRDPAVFLFDEPLSNLDAQLRVQMRFEIKQLHERLAATAIYVTHDQVEAMTLGSRVVVMDRGIVQQVGTPLGIYERPINRFVAQFIGSPGMNFIECQVQREGSNLRLVTEQLHLAIPESRKNAVEACRASEVVIGIRPEHVAVLGSDGGGTDGFSASIEGVEALGSQTYLNLAIGPHRLVASVPPATAFRAHQRVTVALSAERVHLFQRGAHGAAIL